MQPDPHTYLAALLLSIAACTFSTLGLDVPPEAADTSTGGPVAPTSAATATTEPGTSASTSTSTPDTSPSATTAPGTTSTPPGDSTSSTDTVDPGECIGAVLGNEHCGGDTPYCVAGQCVGCPDVDCATIDVNKPACVESSGVCVECQEHSDCPSEAKPACDQATATCKGCTEHEECPETACDLETGMCMPTDCVYFVNLTKIGEFPCNDAGAGTTQQTPLCTLQKAATLLQADKPCTIKVKAGSQFQTAPTIIPAGNITVAIIHYGDTLPSLQVPNDPAITIQAGNRVYMRRIAITNSPPTANPAIECTGASLWLDNQRISNTRTALHALDCEVHVRRSIIFGHTFGGLDIQGTDVSKAQLWLENSYITSMMSSIFGAVRLNGAVKADVLYSTIALVKSIVPPFDCIGGFSGTINVRNSAVIGPDPRFGAGCMPKLNIVTSYESVESTQADLDDTFATFADGQLMAQPEGPLLDVAIWMPGDPVVDHDGTPRPKMAGNDFAGADRPVP